ncbi:hypothetical protein [Meiothermus taiwanensis]|uniref:Uncharacterized protein n=1 Tax=Meiothermus taiwanensis TaxID=172827 RepID=A0A399DUD8_9DEIN|nr:hypothetical protein [Meiothermus taiwanensis]RIH75289.1 hypothetical protein Mcate_02301 [Meiothermus taiwanensis]
MIRVVELWCAQAEGREEEALLELTELSRWVLVAEAIRGKGG